MIRNFFTFMIVCMLLCGCSRPEETVQIPMPENLDEVDPLIAELITRSATDIVADPNNADTWAMHASTLLANAYYEESVETSRQALDLDASDRLPLRYRQAVALWRLNQQEEAIAELKGVLADEPSYDFGWRNLATWHVERGELDLASDAINTAWSIAPNRPGTLATFVRVMMQQDRADAAILKLEPRLDKDDTPAYLYFLAAQAYRRLGETQLMESVSVQAQPLPNMWPDPWLNEIALLATGKRMLATNALAMLRQRGPKEALPLLKRAFDADPSNSQIRGAYAMSLMSTKQEAASLKVIEGAIDAENAVEDYWIAYANIAVEIAKRGDQQIWLPKAMDCFKQAEEISGGSPQLCRSMARLATAMDNTSGSVAYYLAGAEMLIAAGELQGAKSLLGEALMVHTENPLLQERLQSLLNTQ